MNQCQFVVEDPLAVVAEDTSTWSSGVELRATHIHVTGAGRELPQYVRGAPSLHAALPLHRGALDEVIATIASRVPASATATRDRVRQMAGGA